MPNFSCFSGFANGFAFSSEPSRGERIYDAIVAMESRAFDLTPGTPEEARVYATAMGLARARYALDRAQNQEDPERVVELLPQKEKDWGVVPREDAGIVARQRALKAAMLLSKGAVRPAMEAGLRSLLGDDFIALRSLMRYESVSSETASVFARPDLPYKVVRLLDPVTNSGPFYFVRYESLDPSASPVVAGDVLLVHPENLGLREVVTVTLTSTAPDGTGTPTLLATFTKSHEAGTLATTQNYCTWTSTQRTLYVVAKAASARDPEKRRLVDEYMAKVCRGTTGWAIVEPSTPGARTIGRFALDTSPLGAVSIGTMTIEQPKTLSVTGISPGRTPAAGGATVTLSGTGFLAYLELGGLLLVGATPATPTIVSDFSLTFAAPAHAAGPAIVTFSITGEGNASTVLVYV